MTERTDLGTPPTCEARAGGEPGAAPKRTALYEEHVRSGAVFTDFGGWDMPLRYGSELAEHRAVREAAGLFDLSHMGEVWLEGPGAATALGTALVGDFSNLAEGRAKYSLICNERGGIDDDVIVYRVADERFLVVPNAGNALAVAEALNARAAGFDVAVTDATDDTSLIALQGPATEQILTTLLPEAERERVAGLRYYAITALTIAGIDVLLARTGYTGEDGFEIFLPGVHARALWETLLTAGAAFGAVPAGLAARDSLRLEAGMPLYGSELSSTTTPFEAGLGRVVSLTKAEPFIGRDALERDAAELPSGSTRVLVGLRGRGRRAARCGSALYAGEEQIGWVTSGLLSPTLGYPIALAYIEREHAHIGNEIDVDVRGTRQQFHIVEPQFYTRDR